MMKNVLMVGAGSVGGFYGAHLARRHAGVSFLLRPRTLKAVREHGLTVKSASGTFTVHPACDDDPRRLPSPDLVILSVKAYDVDEALEQLAPVVTDRTVILTLQNGMDTEERVLSRFKRDCVVGGVAYIYSKIAEPGVIEHYKRGAVAIGELSGAPSARTAAVAALFREAGLSCQIADNIRRTKWEKMCWNCVFNPVTVLIDDRVARALEHAEVLETIRQIVQEVAAVASAAGEPLPDDMATKVVRWTQEIRDIHTSMYDDWKAGRRTEIDSLNGYIVTRGRAFGVPTPVNQALTALVKVVTSRERAGSDTIVLDGAVIQPVTLTRQALAQLPAESRLQNLSTVVAGRQATGIRVKALLDLPALRIGVDHVTVHAADGTFAASLSLRDAVEHGVLVYEVDGEALPPQSGGPYRFIAPGLGDLCANVKAVGRFEFTVGPGKDTRPSVRAGS